MRTYQYFVSPGSITVTMTAETLQAKNVLWRFICQRNPTLFHLKYAIEFNSSESFFELVSIIIKDIKKQLQNSVDPNTDANSHV